jgi:hypothetical protein
LFETSFDTANIKDKHVAGGILSGKMVKLWRDPNIRYKHEKIIFLSMNNPVTILYGVGLPSLYIKFRFCSNL